MWSPGRLVIGITFCAASVILLLVLYHHGDMRRGQQDSLVMVNIAVVWQRYDVTRLTVTANYIPQKGVFRHGERNILRHYKLDPFGDIRFWPDGYGELTNRGKLSMYKLGLRLRNHYGEFIPVVYSKEDILVRSSPTDRCLMSSSLVLAGMYPPTAHQVWNYDIPWQPVPIHSAVEGEDKVIKMDAPCPKFSKEYEEVLFRSPELRRLNQKYLPDLQHVNKHLGSNYSDIRDTVGIHDTLYIEDMRGFTLFNWTKNIYPEKSKELLMFSHEYLTYTPTMKRLRIGPLLKEITQNMAEKVAGMLRENRKMFLYSAHDSTITSLLRGIGLDGHFLVKYGASVVFELHRVNNTSEVRVLYADDSHFSHITTLDIPGCPAPCQIEQFLHVLQPVIPHSWNIECQI